MWSLLCCYNAILDSSHTHTRTYLANIHFGDARDMTLECIGTAIHFLSHGDGDGVGVEDCGFYKFCFYGHRQEKMQHPSLCVNIVPQYHSMRTPLPVYLWCSCVPLCTHNTGCNLPTGTSLSQQATRHELNGFYLSSS